MSKVALKNLYIFIFFFCFLTFSFFFSLQFYKKFFTQFAFELFEFDSTFKNNHMIVFCILRQTQFKIFVLILIDNDAFVYVFIDKFFAQLHNLSFRLLQYSRRFREFDNQLVLIENIIYVVEIIITLKNYIEKLFLYVIELN